MLKFATLILAAALIAAPAMARTMDDTYVPAPKPAVRPVISAPPEKLRTAIEADRLTRVSGDAANPPGTLNGDQKNDKAYVLFWPDWTSDLETPAHFNK